MKAGSAHYFEEQEREEECPFGLGTWKTTSRSTSMPKDCSHVLSQNTSWFESPWGTWLAAPPRADTQAPVDSLIEAFEEVGEPAYSVYLEKRVPARHWTRTREAYLELMKAFDKHQREGGEFRSALGLSTPQDLVDRFWSSLWCASHIQSLEMIQAKHALSARWWDLPNEAVVAFLADHPGVESALFSSYPHLVQAFSNPPRARLVISHDPLDGSVSLVCLLRMKGTAKEAVQALGRFEDNWWIDHIDEADFLLTFLIDADAF